MRRAIDGRHMAVVTTLAVMVSACAPVVAEREPATPTTATTASPAPSVATDEPSATPSTSSTSPAATSSPTGGAAGPPAVTTWEPAPDEVHLEIKQVATTVALGLTTYDADASAEQVVAAVVDDPQRQRALADAAAELLHDGRWSRGRVVYPQMGGLTDDRASVMVVVEQTVGGNGPAAVETRTIDVRLERAGGRWAFDRLESAGGPVAPRPADLSPVAEAVLDDPRIELPDSARWDIHRGAIDDSLLRVMRDLADRTPYGVVVLSSGHPFDVFETGRPSSHSRGHAVDIHRLDDELVVAGRDDADSRTHRTARWLYDQPDVSNLGSPWAFDGFGGRSFTDAVHLDHLHVSAAPGTS